MASIWDGYQRQMHEMQQMRNAQQGMQQAMQNYPRPEQLCAAFPNTPKDVLDRNAQLLLLEDVK